MLRRLEHLCSGDRIRELELLSEEEKKVPRRFWSPFRSFRDFRASKEATRIAGEGFLRGHSVMVEWFESERGELQTKC